MLRIILDLDEEGQQKIFALAPNVREVIHLALELSFGRRMDRACAALGVGRSEISHWRSGERRLPEKVVVVLAAMLNIPEEIINAPIEGRSWRRTRAGKYPRPPREVRDDDDE